MNENNQLTPEQMEILKVVEKSTAKDLAKPQQLTDEEKALLDELDKKPPAEHGQEDDAAENFFKNRKRDFEPKSDL